MKTKSSILLLFSALTYSVVFAQGAWTQKANCGGPETNGAVGFSIDTKGYIMCGGPYCAVWEWEQTTNVWTQKTDYPQDDYYRAAGFSIGTKGYYGTGNPGAGCGNPGISYSVGTNSFYEFDPVANTWTAKANVPVSTYASVGFSIGSKGYIVGGGMNNCYEYDPSTDSWTAKTPYPGFGNQAMTAFSIGTKGYVGCGLLGTSYQNDFWEFDPVANTWAAKAAFGGTVRKGAVGFSIGTKGYIGTGFDGTTYYNDFWEWNQSTNVWTQKTNFGGTPREAAVGFSIGIKGYIGTGNVTNDFWEFDPSGIQGVEELKNIQGITIYPNPASQMLYVKLAQPLQYTTTLKIMDISGRELLTQSANRMKDIIQVDVAALPDGIYFISIENSKRIFVKQ